KDRVRPDKFPNFIQKALETRPVKRMGGRRRGKPLLLDRFVCLRKREGQAPPAKRKQIALIRLRHARASRKSIPCVSPRIRVNLSGLNVGGAPACGRSAARYRCERRGG